MIFELCVTDNLLTLILLLNYYLAKIVIDGSTVLVVVDSLESTSSRVDCLVVGVIPVRDVPCWMMGGRSR